MDTREVFAQSDLRCTAQRMAVFESLCATTSHPTAEELHDLVNERGIEISLATVYNTLDVLCTAGLATRLPSVNQCCRFDANTEPHLHVSFADSEEIADVPHDLSQRLLSSLPADVLREIEQSMGLQIEALNIELIGRRTNGTPLQESPYNQRR